MCIVIFKENVKLLQTFAYKLKREEVPVAIQKILIKTYADDLKIKLTEQMIGELLLH